MLSIGYVIVYSFYLAVRNYHSEILLVDLGYDDVKIILSDGMVPLTDDGGIREVYEKLENNVSVIDRPREVMTIKGEVSHNKGKELDEIIAVPNPGKGVEIEYTAGFDKYMALPDKTFTYALGKNNYSEIADARTINFGSIGPFYLPVKFGIRSLIGAFAYPGTFGIGHGATKNNMILVGNKNNPNLLNELHYEDEYTKHKIIDFGSVLSMLGYPVNDIRFLVKKSGHNEDLIFAGKLKEKLAPWPA